MKPFDTIKHSDAYVAIADYYGDRKAERSGVRLMQHIDDGLVVLDQINASGAAMRAYCLHPLFQQDDDLTSSAEAMRDFAPVATRDPYVMLLVMEYRYRANAWLSDKVRTIERKSAGERVISDGLPVPGVLEEVWHMLIADKVQNRKDFLTHHKGTHPRSAELELYFGHWLLALDVDEAEYEKLCTAIDAAKS